MHRVVRHSLYALCLAWSCIFLVALVQAQDQPKEPPKDFEQDEEGFQKAREAWFYGQRAYPHKTVPPGARLKAWQQMQVRLAAEQAARSRGNASDVGSWQLIGPATMNGYWGPNSGRVSAVAVDPANNQIVYAGAAQGGIWKTTNGGAAWTPLTDTQASLATGSIAIDPQNHLTIYVGTGEENNSGDSYYGEGILKSTDGGNTWTNIPGQFAGGGGGGARIGGLAVQPNNSSVVLAAVGCCAPGPSGVYRSADAGQTWTQVLNVNYSQAYNVIFDPNTPTTAYASINGDSVYKSTDGGNTWTAANGSGATALPLSGSGRVALAMDPNATTTLWAAIASNTHNDLAGLFKTTDGGNTWTNLPNTPDFCEGQCWYDLALAVQPGNSNVIFAGGAQNSSGSVVQSLDGGNTWTIYANIHPDAHAFVFTPDGSILYVGNDGGMWSTTQITSTAINWTNLNTGLATEQFYPGLSIDSNNANIGFGGTQDNGTESYIGTTTWNVVNCGDGGVTLIDNTTNPDTVYANCIGATFTKSTNGGLSFQSAQNGINTSDKVSWTPPAAIDPANPQRLYFGTQYVYQTTNGAGTWKEISPDLTNGATLTAIAVSPVNPNTVWAGSGDSQVSITQNALAGTSASWSNVTGTDMLPNRYITAIAADPQQAGTAYVAFSGFSGYGDNLGHVFTTTNAGASWTDISGNLPNIPADDIVVDPLQANTLYVATDFGVFYTTNGGTAWGTLVNGLPRAAVLSLKLHPSRNLFAATHGRSMWETNVSSVTAIPSIVGLSPPSATAGASTFTLTVNGGAFTPAAIVQWNGADLATTYLSATQLTATVPASDLTQPGTFEVTVIIPGGGVSNSFGFTIQAPQLSITKSHSGNFTQGQNGAIYSVTVGNMGSGPTGGPASVTEAVPTGLTLVSMSGSGTSSAATWSCAGNSCTASSVLAAGASYPSIVVTVNVAQNAPAQATNQVNVSANGSGTAGASDVTIIQPLLANAVLSKSTPSGCTAPPAASAFLATDSQAFLWFEVNYANAGDTATANWYAPNGSLYRTDSLGATSSAGVWCFWDAINIAGSTPASEPGNWSVKIDWNNSLLSTLPFTIASTNYTLTVTEVGQGTVTSTDGQINCVNGSGACSASYTSGSTVTLNAAAATNWTFAGWSGASSGSCNGGNPCSLAMTQNLSPTATFTQTYTISGQVTLAGGGLPGVRVTLSGSQSGTTATDSSGNYSFTEATGGSYTVIPSLSGYTFTPPGHTFTNLSGNQVGNFSATSGLRFISMPPCRVVDTRDGNKPTGFGTPFISGGTTRSFAIANGPCGSLAGAQAYSLNVTVVPHGELGYLTVWPTGQSRPVVSTLNSLDGRIKANAAIVPAGTGGAISVFATNDTDVVLDINGYFVPPTDPNGLAFYPMTPCRLVDTRLGAPSTLITGALTGETSTSLPILSSSCNVPSTALAYSLNFTLVPPGPVGYLTVYPTGESLPIVSTLNDPTGTVEANAAVAPAGTGGSIDVFATQTTDLVVDINGYFAPVSAGGLSLYTLPTCRALDTRNPPGAPPFMGTINVDVIGSGCGGTSAAQAYVLNATVVPQGPLGYLTLWPEGSPRPVVSTLNALDGAITSNMALVPTSTTEISAFANANTYLILDISGYFAP
jgi:photosystem II stability/assembly factor-like uncharacterized protein